MALSRPLAPPWKAGVVFVCKKCERRSGLDVRAWLKKKLKLRKASPQVRVVSTSCLDVCPKHRVTVVLHPSVGVGSACLVVDKAGRAALQERLERMAAPGMDER